MLIALLATTASAQPTDEADGPFAKAIAVAQARTVKVYGAGIGRDPGYATGLIVSSDGRILVAQGVYLAGQRIRVTLPDGTDHEADVERRSDPLQLALLKIQAQTPEYFEVSEQPVADKGDWVVAVSNAFKVATGDEPLSVNLGVVSLRTRLDAKRGTQSVPYDGDVLLIDAITSNPGAAGGAVVTADGRLAGMIGKIIESRNTGTRLNYAVPSDLIHRFLTGRPLDVAASPSTGSGRAMLGIRLFELGGKRGPAFVDRVLSNSPAATAGIRADDLILAIGEQRLRDIRDYDAALDKLRSGVTVEVLVKRGNELLRIPVTPVAEPGTN